MKNDAFMMKPFFFIHCCQNCIYSVKESDANGNTIGYACELKEDWAFVNGKHICDVSEVKDTNQLEWDLKEDV